MSSSQDVAAAVRVSPPAVAAPPIERRRGQWIRTIGARYALVVLFGILFVMFSASTDQFLTARNLQNVIGNQSALVLLALAALPPLVAGHFDLSVGAGIGVSSMVTASLMSQHHQPLIVAVVAALVVGAVIGVVNGLIIVGIGVNSLIVTLAMATVLQGAVQWYTDGTTITTGISDNLISAASGPPVLGVPRAAFWFVPVAVLLWYVLQHTPIGRYVTAIGSNATAARLVGLPVGRVVVGAFVSSGVLAAVAGVLLVGLSGSADPQTSLGQMLLPALAAAFLGTSVFRPGNFNVPGTVLAVYFVAFSVSGLELWGTASWIEQLFDGAALIVAVSASALIGGRRQV